MRLGRRLAVGVAVETVEAVQEQDLSPVTPAEPAELAVPTEHPPVRAEELAGQSTER